MTGMHKKTKLVSVFSSVLMLSFYGRVSQEAFLALVLSSLAFFILGGLTYFLRMWMTAQWTQALMVVLAALAAQVVWIQRGMEPWWMLAVLGLLLPAVTEIREPLRLLEVTLAALVLEASALCFFAARSALELTAGRFFWEQPAGHWSLIGLIALTVSVLETRGEPHGS